jgi:pyruvate dehydrogenase E2 component (dihydrolipoamide acetyltransferase)
MVITMPQLGETVTEGTVVRWYKAVGDAVAVDETLFEVSTDKVDSEVPSPSAGTISEILVAEGETVPIGTALAVVTAPGEAVETIAAPAAEPAVEPAAAPVAMPAPSVEERAPADSAAPLTPVGLGANVTRADVQQRLEQRATPLADLARRVTPTPSSPTGSTPVGSAPAAAGPSDDVVPLTNIRRRTAEHMMRSLATSAHTLVVMEVDYSGVERARAAVRDSFRATEGFGLTSLPFVARAVIDGISEFPFVNASLGEDALIVHRDVHLGVAVDLEFEGLVVPVIRDAGTLRLPALARATRERAVAARERTLTADDLTGGTFTLTNAGGYGTVLTAPIINQPQVAIISTDGVSMRPVAVRTDEPDREPDHKPDRDPADARAEADRAHYGVAIHPVGNLALSFDHRAFDGAYASAFLRRVVQILTTRDWSEELA